MRDLYRILYCVHEIQKCRQLQKELPNFADKLGAAMGELDWMTELRRLIYG